MKKIVSIAIIVCLAKIAAAQTTTQQMLDRFLSYVQIESQSHYPAPNDLDQFPITDGQRQMAQKIYDDLGAIKGVEVRMSSCAYVYAKIPANTKKAVPSVAFMAHLDVSCEANGNNIRPKVFRNYDGGTIQLGNGKFLCPDSIQGTHLKDLVGKTIVTGDGSTLLGADCKSGCAILVELAGQMARDKRFKHGDVYLIFSQNEDIGLAAEKLELNILGATPDMLIDVDGDDNGCYSVSNFTAEGRTYLFKGNLCHPANAHDNGYADARTAMAYFVGQLPPDVHPTHSTGKEGYIHCYAMDQLDNQSDVRIGFRIRYFDKKDGVRFATLMDSALHNTQEAFPTVGITLENSFVSYDNVAYSMHPKLPETIQNAATKTGIKMKPIDLRAGTTGAMMVARGLPGASAIYGGQQNAHGVYEYCCIEELIDITRLCRQIVGDVYVDFN